jgi:hypothetical protein
MAATQIAEAIERNPERAGTLVPLLAVAIRSIRAPEFRAGLAALVRAATRRPDIGDAMSRVLPEVRLGS